MNLPAKKIIIIVLTALFSSSSHATSLDSFIKAYTGQSPNALGPNCFGTALAATANFIYTGYMHEGEHQAILNSPLCQELPLSTPLEKGVLLSVKVTQVRKQKQFSQFVHASIFLKEGIVFEKSTYSSSDQPRILSFAQSLEPYTNAPLNTIRRDSLYANSNVGTWVQAHSCESMEAYLKRNHAKWRESNKRFWKKLNIESENLRKWTQEENTFIDALRGCSQRLISMEGELTRAHTARTTNLIKKSELKPREAIWLEAPAWITMLTIARIQSMNKQVQLLIAAQTPPKRRSQ